MSVKAFIAIDEKTTIQRVFQDFSQLAAWMGEHHGEYIGFTAHEMGAGKIKQGREGEQWVKGWNGNMQSIIE